MKKVLDENNSYFQIEKHDKDAAKIVVSIADASDSGKVVMISVEMDTEEFKKMVQEVCG